MGYYETTEETKSTIAQLKREKRYDEALVLCEQWMADPWRPNGVVESEPFQQAAVIHRLVKRYADEVAVLERFAKLPNSGSKQSAKLVYDRLPKAYLLAGLAEQRSMDGREVIYHIASNRPLFEIPPFVKTGLLIDTETTGFGAADELIEIACILFSVSPINGHIVVLDEYQSLREPGCKIPAAATKVHGLKMADVKGKRIDKRKLGDMLAAAELLVAHNASYDRRFVAPLLPEFAEATWYCSMNGISWKRKGYESKALENLIVQHGIERGRGHRAMDDARATLALLGKCDSGTGEPYVKEMLANSPVGFTSQYEERAKIAPASKPNILNRVLGVFSR